MKPLFVKGVEDIPKNYTGLIEFANRNKRWFLNGKNHRVDGPAVEWADGSKEWYLNGKVHRENGPAYEHINGYKQWWILDNFIADNNNFNRFKNNSIVVERGIPTDKMFGELRLTNARLLTVYGTMFYYDNLPGLDINI